MLEYKMKIYPLSCLAFPDFIKKRFENQEFEK